MKFLWKGRGLRNNRLHFGCDPYHDPDLEILKAIIYRDSYRQPRIKHDNPRRRFELSECFLVIIIIIIIITVVVIGHFPSSHCRRSVCPAR